MRKFTDVNEAFVCRNCGHRVKPSATSCRNHCPQCLYSIHLDDHPGDRNADCGGLMKPVAVIHHSKKGYQVVHKCLTCGIEKRNVLHFEDEMQPDSMEAALEIMKNG